MHRQEFIQDLEQVHRDLANMQVHGIDETRLDVIAKWMTKAEAELSKVSAGRSWNDLVKARVDDRPLPNNRMTAGGAYSTASARRLEPGRSDNDSEQEDEVEPRDFDEAVARLRNRDPKLTRTDAMRRARKFWPDLLAKFETDGVAEQTMHEQLAKIDLAKRRSQPFRDFERMCDEIQKRDNCSRLEAMAKARQEMDPDDFANFRKVLL